MMYVNQIIMLYTLNLYSAEYQLYLNKTEKKKNIMFLHFSGKKVDLSKNNKGYTHRQIFSF